MADPGDLSWWFGDSRNPQDYKNQTQYQDSGQIHDVINQGLAQGNRAAPQASGYSPYNAMQMQQAGQLQRIASGQQQGAGELAVQRQVAQQQAAQQAAARMARGQNAALAYRNAANAQAGIGLQGAGQAQQAALSDQQAAQQQLAGVLGQARGQDQQIQLANLDAQLRMQGMNDQQRMQYLQSLMGMDANQLQAQTAMASNASPGMFPALLQTGGALAGAYIMGKGKPAGGGAG